MTTPGRAGWYPDPLKPETQERRWDGAEWTDDTREASEATRASAASEATRATVVEERAQRASRDQVREAPAPTEDDEPEPAPAGRTTYALVAAIVVLIAVGALELAYLVGPLKDDPKVTAERPVLLSQAAERSAVDSAAKAAVAASARSYETYDDQVDAAAALMTDAFAKEFRTTTDDAKDAWVAGEIEATADVAAQAVMTASEEQVEVLVFLNQFTTKLEDGETKTGTTQFRLKVTMIDDEDRGWLVSDIDAK